MIDRQDAPHDADERATLNGFLDRQRATVHRKVAGLDAAGLRTALTASELTTPGGVVRHLAEVERWWFLYIFEGREVEFPWTDDDPDADFRVPPDADAETLLNGYADACALSRQVVAASDLGALSVRERRGERYSLRWILGHMIEETARHNGHLDLLRESIDGSTGE